VRIPYKPASFKRLKKVRYIIIHDVSCKFSHLSDFYKDSIKMQSNRLRVNDYVLHGESDLSFHFIAERIGDDYETVVGRPITAHCDFDDIIDPYKNAIHIAVMGNFVYESPNARLYKQLAYRVLAPIAQLFRVPYTKIMLHSEVTTDKEMENACPGRNFDKKKLLAHVRMVAIPKG
jgi:hypothetical protein